MIKNKAKILAACKKYGCETITEAVVKTRKAGISYSGAASLLCMTRGQYDHQARRAGIFVAKKNIPTTISEVFQAFDSRIRTDKERKIEKAKELGYTYFSEAIYELLKKHSHRNVCRILSMQSNHIHTYQERIDVALRRIDENKEKKKSKKSGDNMCTHCHIREKDGHFLCNQCWRENSEGVQIYGVMQANGLVGEMR